MANAEKFNPRPSSDWLAKTACKPTDQVLFTKRNLTLEQIKQRNALCNSCEVKQECLEDAMYYGEIGIYRAGKTPDGLREEWRRRNSPNK